MFAKLSRLFHTLRHIKGIQWYYQLRYRIKSRFISIHWYNKYLNESLTSIDVEVAYILQSKQKEYLNKNCYELIGLKHNFEGTIDWNYQGHGKLWNYNLQYLAYTLDENIPSGERFRLLKIFSEQILSGNVKPEPYPVSLRVVNTLLFHSRYPIKDIVVLKALYKQIDYLANNLEYHLLANHLLENAFSLFIASTYLKNTQLLQKAKKLLIVQLEEQVLSDGGHYECSPMYQSILLSKLFICIEVARKATCVTDEIITFLERKASKMLGWINAYSFPDGSWALMNDAAEKIAPTTASLNEAATILNILPVEVVLNDSGFRKMKGANWELLIKSGGVQPSYQPGHVHADISSYCLWYKGQQIIVDPGISTYAISERRNIERGTSAHNTVSINGYNQSDVWGGFRIGKRSRVMILEDSSHCVQIEVCPYFNYRSKHQRKFVKISDQSLVIQDSIQTTSFKTLVKGKIQFARNVSVDHQKGLLKVDGLTIAIQGVENAKLQNGSYAVSYHRLQLGIRYEYHASPVSRFIFTFS
jgi:hypothetical protein